MTVLPVPPVVAQNSAILPDGNLDPAHATDCGEANASSILLVKTSLYFAPGSIRQAMGLPELDGRTTAEELAKFFRCMGLDAVPQFLDTGAAWSELGFSRHYGRYHVTLGYWVGPSLHWETVFARATSEVASMDPWFAKHTITPQGAFNDLYAGEIVTVRI